MKILRVICSPRGQASESYRLSQTIVEWLLEGQPEAEVMDRDIGSGALSPIDENYALSQQLSADVSQEGSAARSETLIAELESSDVVIIATPMHNYTVPSALLIIRQVATTPRCGQAVIATRSPSFGAACTTDVAPKAVSINVGRSTRVAVAVHVGPRYRLGV